MKRPAACPRCGSLELHERVAVPCHGGVGVDFVCDLCGGEAGPVVTPVSASACTILPFARLASKLSRITDASVSLCAPSRGSAS